jgi:transposase
MSKRRVDKEDVLKSMQAFVAGLKSGNECAGELDIGRKTFVEWVRKFNASGIEWFQSKDRNSSYTREFRVKQESAALPYYYGRFAQSSLQTVLTHSCVYGALH